ncbi:hypothetical protein BT93_F3028 [Corymbia citriodora subsp. variegata]|nr:hypothetical protein BT93_F3028 [Corymbia citriodora subsp. variegata]
MLQLQLQLQLLHFPSPSSFFEGDDPSLSLPRSDRWIDCRRPLRLIRSPLVPPLRGGTCAWFPIARIEPRPNLSARAVLMNPFLISVFLFFCLGGAGFLLERHLKRVSAGFDSIRFDSIGSA